MGILDLAGKIAGAVAAVEGAEKLDPDAGLLTKGIAAVAGLEGAGALENLIEKKPDEAAPADNTASDGSAPQDDGSQAQA